jgi:hypothetical protein
MKVLLNFDLPSSVVCAADFIFTITIIFAKSHRNPLDPGAESTRNRAALSNSHANIGAFAAIAPELGCEFFTCVPVNDHLIGW